MREFPVRRHANSVFSFALSPSFLTSRTDQDGSFRIEGAPVGGGHTLVVTPKLSAPYFETEIRLPRQRNLTSIDYDIELKRAHWLSGTVRDAAGNPVRAMVEYYPFRENPHAEQYPNYDPQLAVKLPNEQKQTDERGTIQNPSDCWPRSSRGSGRRSKLRPRLSVGSQRWDFRVG